MSIQVNNLIHIYNEGLPHESVAVDDVSFEIQDGSFTGIIGHTGSGKSTLVQHLNGLVKPKSGDIIIDGQNITSGDIPMTQIRRKVGLVFQYPEYQLFEETVAMDVAFGPRNLGLSEDEIESRVRESIELVGFDYETIKDKSPFELSGGQKRRVAIAGVLAMKPSVLILDEPTAGLDPKAHNDILSMIRDVHEREQNIIILVSHNMNDIAELADNVIVMDHGQIAINGSPEHVFADRSSLTSIGLDVPPAAQIIDELNERGFQLNSNVYSAEQVAAAIFNEMKDNSK